MTDEQTPKDTEPEEYRGGTAEPADAKGGAGELAHGMVPDEASDDTPAPDTTGEEPSAQEPDEVLGGFPDDPDMDIDLSAGDNADATRDGQSGGARGSEAGAGRHDPDMDVEEEDVANQ